MGGALKGDSPSRGGGAAPTPTPRPRPPLPPSARPRLPTQNASRCCRPVADNLIGTFVMSKCKNTLFLLPSFSPPPAHSPSCPWNSQKSGPRARPQLRPSCLPPAYPLFPPPHPGQGWRAEPWGPVQAPTFTNGGLGRVTSPLPSPVIIWEHLGPACLTGNK